MERRIPDFHCTHRHLQESSRLSYLSQRKSEGTSPCFRWSPELREWIEWRLGQATAESRLRGEVALFSNPNARNAAKRWTPDALERQWNRACKEAIGFVVPFQQGTRHTTLTALGQELPERVLREFSRHRDQRSLDHYSRPRATPEAIVRALRPGSKV